MSSKKVAIPVLVALLVVLLVAVAKHSINPNKPIPPTQTAQQNYTFVQLVTTKPSPLDQAIILPTQAVSITFDTPAQNVPELKIQLDPQVDVDMRLSDDRKTLTITPKSSFGLKQGYTLVIPTDAKFDGGKKLKEDQVFHFSTIDYQGV